MRRLSMLATCLLLFGCLTGTTRASQNTIIGDWVGGVQIKDKWFVVQAHFEPASWQCMSPLPGLRCEFGFGYPRLASWATNIPPLPGLSCHVAQPIVIFSDSIPPGTTSLIAR
jgi:hypothetical protein